MKIQYIDNNQFLPPLKPLNPQKVGSAPEIKEGYVLCGYRKESISTWKRIKLIILSALIAPLFIKDIRRQIGKGKEIVYYCNKINSSGAIKKVENAVNNIILPSSQNIKEDASSIKSDQDNQFSASSKKNERREKKEDFIDLSDNPIQNIRADQEKETPVLLNKSEITGEPEVFIDLSNGPIQDKGSLARDSQIEKLLKMDIKALEEEGLKNPFNYNLNLSPFSCELDETFTHLLKVLNQLPKETSHYFLLGLLKNPDTKEQFFITCFRLIHENFKEDNVARMSEKKMNLYSLCLYYSDLNLIFYS